VKILLTGKNGQVGWELAQSLAPLGEVMACDRSALDLANPDRITAVIRDTRPDIIVNAAAYTAVDKAESEPDLAHAINAEAPRVLAGEAKKLGALLVHYSTDYVFDGNKAGAYTEEDTPNPVNVYGQSKLAGEIAIQSSGCRHLIFRTSWVYGPRGANFLLTMLRLGKEREELQVVDDQLGAPTSSRMIAEATTHTLRKDSSGGLFHLAAAGRTSWCGFARKIFETAGLKTRVVPIASAQYRTAAKRPINSALDCEKLRQTFGFTPPNWESEVEKCLDTINGRQKVRDPE